MLPTELSSGNGDSKDIKDQLPMDKRKGVIHSIECDDCKAIYIRETGRSAEQRVKEHRAHLTHGREQQSAITKHVVEEAHNIHWCPHIIKKEPDKTKRKVKEVLAIHKVEKMKGAMNEDCGLQISKLWLDLV